MAILQFVLPVAVLIVALIAVAIYEHINSITLSLPLSSALTIGSLLLPLIAALNTYLLPFLYRKASSSATRYVFAHPVILQILQGIFTTVLATLYLHDMVPGEVRDCELSTRWQRLFHGKDEVAIRTIQDAFQCCGFNSVKDRAFPFRRRGVIECADRYERSLACKGPWTSALQRNASVEFWVVIAVGVLQIVGVLLARWFASRSPNFSWSEVLRQTKRPQRRIVGSAERPLLRGRETQTDDIDEEVGETRHENGRRYGAVEESGGAGPRMEPSGLHQEANQWRNA